MKHVVADHDASAQEKLDRADGAGVREIRRHHPPLATGFRQQVLLGPGRARSVDLRSLGHQAAPFPAGCWARKSSKRITPGWEPWPMRRKPHLRRTPIDGVSSGSVSAIARRTAGTAKAC